MEEIIDNFNLQRFVEAQNYRDPGYQSILEELRSGYKCTHWMWYIFPQVQGLGKSELAQTYAISSQAEARAYSEHPILGFRLQECTNLVMKIEGVDAKKIFGYTDCLKFHSSMTLFELSAVDPSIFRDALNKYYGGEPDTLTLQILKATLAQR